MSIKTTIRYQSTYPIAYLCGSCVRGWTGLGTEACDGMALLESFLRLKACRMTVKQEVVLLADGNIDTGI
jgi:hypothetical protein